MATTAAADLLDVIESDTDTLTDAVASGRVTLEDVHEFLRGVERGEIDAGTAVDSLVWIVTSLLEGDAGDWEELEPAGI